MTARKTAAKKTATKPEPETKQVLDLQPVEDSAPPEMDGTEYQQGYAGVASDDEDYSVAAQVAKLAAESGDDGPAAA